MAIEHHASLWRTFWTNAVLAPRTSLGFMRADYVFGSVVIVPFTQMVFFATVAGLAGNAQASVAFVVLGNAVATVTYTSIFAVCQTTDQEKNHGTMEHLLVSPANRVAMYLGRGFIPILTSLATVTVGLVYAALIFHVSFAAVNLPFLAFSIAITTVAMVSFGLLLGGVALFLRTSIILGNIFLFIGLLLSGVNFPVTFLPEPVRLAGEFFPLTWGVAAVRASVAGDGLATLWPLWGYVAVELFGSLVLAMALWQVFERRALATGSIVRF
ncbi:MAG TPA: ABC transporter permease [Thermoplasmata archaeon]|nr:ABC transporter permease [Thermoplasmata archaeon]